MEDALTDYAIHLTRRALYILPVGSATIHEVQRRRKKRRKAADPLKHWAEHSIAHGDTVRALYGPTPVGLLGRLQQQGARLLLCPTTRISGDAGLAIRRDDSAMAESDAQIDKERERAKAVCEALADMRPGDFLPEIALTRPILEIAQLFRARDTVIRWRRRAVQVVEGQQESLDWLIPADHNLFNLLTGMLPGKRGAAASAGDEASNDEDTDESEAGIKIFGRWQRILDKQLAVRFAALPPNLQRALSGEDLTLPPEHPANQGRRVGIGPVLKQGLLSHLLDIRRFASPRGAILYAGWGTRDGRKQAMRKGKPTGYNPALQSLIYGFCQYLRSLPGLDRYRDTDVAAESYWYQRWQTYRVQREAVHDADRCQTCRKVKNLEARANTAARHVAGHAWRRVAQEFLTMVWIGWHHAIATSGAPRESDASDRDRADAPAVRKTRRGSADRAVPRPRSQNPPSPTKSTNPRAGGRRSPGNGEREYA